MNQSSVHQSPSLALLSWMPGEESGRENYTGDLREAPVICAHRPLPGAYSIDPA